MEKSDYWTKNGNELRLAEELAWNFPEQRIKTVSIVGGNLAGFVTEIKIAEYIDKKLPFYKAIKNVFPISLKPKFPSGMTRLEFYDATESGGFGKSMEFYHSISGADLAIFSGDLSKNSETAIAVTEVLKRNEEVLTILTRDTLDLVAAEMGDLMMRENLILIGSLAQMQKIFRAVYYPRPILVSQPIFPIVEALHKFSLSYPVAILTFHEGQVIAVKNGQIISVPIETTTYNPISLWGGEVAAKVGTFALFNERRILESLVAGLLYR